jgi:hypothetical protein
MCQLNRLVSITSLHAIYIVSWQVFRNLVLPILTRESTEKGIAITQQQVTIPFQGNFAKSNK